MVHPGAFCVCIAYDQGMLGWILHVGQPQYDRLEERSQMPCFIDQCGPVYEVWIWHRLLKRWFCMTYGSVANDVVPFEPGNIPALRQTMQQLERAAGVAR